MKLNHMKERITRLMACEKKSLHNPIWEKGYFRHSVLCDLYINIRVQIYKVFGTFNLYYTTTIEIDTAVS